AYVVDAPVWRISYRLEKRPDAVVLQGWAHVNNVTGNDWPGVELVLRSGQPTTFHADLFAPLIAERPSLGWSVFGFPENLNLISQWFGMAPPARFSQQRSRRLGIGFGGGMGGMGFGGFGGGSDGNEAASDPPSQDEMRLNLTRGVEPVAEQGRAVQEVQFRLSDPVNLESGKSASLPIFSQQLPATSFSLVIDHGETDNLISRRAIELVNTTPHALVPGPVSVMDSGAFVGDSTLERLSQQGTARVLYGIDRGLIVSRTDTPHVDSVNRIDVTKEDVQAHRRESFDIRLQLRNEDSEARMVVYDLQLSESDGQLFHIARPDPVDTNLDRAIFRVSVPSAASQELVIRLERDYSDTMRLSSVSTSLIDEWLRGDTQMSPSTRDKLTALATLQRNISENEATLKQLGDERQQLIDEQKRTRSNIESLGSDTAPAATFTAALMELEASIQKLNQQIAEHTKVARQFDDQRAELMTGK
ncbi:MAG: DUF4139 domain-containing protein, partial [Planctomycetales bacterium]|nr:DUF4139 domain-containing protein [Planctomycetales bacterium]